MANDIEPKWQQTWAHKQTFRVANPGEAGFDAQKPKFYCLDMFPYPSGAGLHVGHPEGYTATDILCRFKRMKGFNVLHPMGWDAFGLPAEQYAVQTNVHPAVTTRKAIDTFRRQLQRFGFSYDWSREIATIDPEYYRWTQWIWLKAYNAWYDPRVNAARPIDELVGLLESGKMGINLAGEIVFIGPAPAAITGTPIGLRRWHEVSPQEKRELIDGLRLAYLAEQTVNWCPKLGTVLANEEVIDGRSERGGFPVLRMPLRQWMFRITAYAERLLDDLALVKWPESTRTQQTEWIGRSEGAEIDFEIVSDADPDGMERRTVRVFTTRPDTVFGATYMVLAPEHPLVDEAMTDPNLAFAGRDQLRAYVDAARNRADVDRMADTKEKTGVFTGLHAMNPATGKRIPVWTADYVLMGYGHGAIMAVPAHDQRDFEFAIKFKLPIRDVVYSRPVFAMHYFVMHAPVEARGDEVWAGVLADFLGLVMSENIAPSSFDHALETVLKRARNEHTAIEFDLSSCATDLPGAVGRRRGLTRITWLDTIEALGLTSFGMLQQRMEQGTWCAESEDAYTGSGTNVNSANDEVSLNGLSTSDAKARMVEWLESTGIGRRKVNYKLRDWLFSRQRYWGEPFPVVFDREGNHYPVDESHLPVRLPELEDFKPIESQSPTPPLGKATDWVKTTAGEAGVSPKVLDPATPVQRETNTMPNWAGSCWYYLRFCDPRNEIRLISREAEQYWMVSSRDDGTMHAGGIDLYVGGAEHAVLHLLYARFWHKVLFDLGYVSTPEPFGRLFHQGIITSFAYQRADRSLVPTDEVEEKGDGVFVEKATGSTVTQIAAKMSKSLKNVVNPDEVITEFGADTFRLYEMYMGPLEATKPWNPRDIAGLFRFLQRAWRLAVDESTGEIRRAAAADENIEKQLHRTIAKVEADIERLALNTAIAAMIEFVNAASSSGLSTDQLDRFTRILSPFAPHLAEEIWARMGRSTCVSTEPWPVVNEALLKDESVEVPVQIMGKVKARIMVPAEADTATHESIALADERVKALIEGKNVKKIIVVPGKMVNIVAN